MRNENIPTKEYFARAKAADKYRNRALSDTAEFIKKKYKDNDVIQVFIFYSPSD